MARKLVAVSKKTPKSRATKAAPPAKKKATPRAAAATQPGKKSKASARKIVKVKPTATLKTAPAKQRAASTPASAGKPKSAKSAKIVKIPTAKARGTPGVPEQVRDVILRVLDDRQAEQIVTIDLRGKSSMADYLIIGSGRAARQIGAIADIIRAELGKIGIRQVRAEGVTQGDWVLVDAGDVIVHLFRPEVRRFYNIEQIYGT